MEVPSDHSWLTTSIARHIWETRYRWAEDGEPQDRDIDATWRRVARAVASEESSQQPVWEEKFYSILWGFHFLPAGRILAGAGLTLKTCYERNVPSR